MQNRTEKTLESERNKQLRSRKSVMDGVRTMKLPLHLNITQDPERGKGEIKRHN